MRLSFLFLLFALVLSGVSAQDKVLKVWPNGAPNVNGADVQQIIFSSVYVKDISEAEMYVYLPPKEKNTGVAIVICPGGGYYFEAMDYEGHDIAKWLNTLGIAGIVLKYRLPNGHANIPSSDGKQAIRIVRENAKEWRINPEKVGIAGFSAGGHLASTVGTHFDYGDKNSISATGRFSCRPDFMLLLYPVISLKEEFGHMGSRINLIGKGNNWELVKEYSNELHVTPQTPPTFIAVTNDDQIVQTRNSVEFYLALKQNNIPAELHVFAEGLHGFFLKKENLPVRQWPNLFFDWLKAIKIVEE